jgi:hypothetical protein
MRPRAAALQNFAFEEPLLSFILEGIAVDYFWSLPVMEYRQYGSTGIKVSALGMGGMRFKEQDDLHKCSRMLLRALEGGINYFDTASGYGKSEETFGHAVPDMKKTGVPFYIATKTFGDTEAAIRKDCEQSLKRMNLDCIDFYHVWCIINYSELERRRSVGCLETMQKLKNEGKVRHVCMSTHMPGADITRALAEHGDLFAGVLLGYNGANFPYRQEGVEGAARLHKGVVTMNPLGGGVIPDNPDRFAYLKRDPGESAVDAAIRFNMSHPGITVTLVGMRHEQDVDEALKAAQGFTPLTSAEMSRIKAQAGAGIEGLCTMCGYCKECPQHIPVMKFIESMNAFLLNPEKSWRRVSGELRGYWGIQSLDQLAECIECRKCEEACTQGLPILERFEEIKRLWAKAEAEKQQKK